jgi:hypothetical protein
MTAFCGMAAPRTTATSARIEKIASFIFGLSILLAEVDGLR